MLAQIIQPLHCSRFHLRQTSNMQQLRTWLQTQSINPHMTPAVCSVHFIQNARKLQPRKEAPKEPRESIEFWNPTLSKFRKKPAWSRCLITRFPVLLCMSTLDHSSLALHLGSRSCAAVFAAVRGSALKICLFVRILFCLACYFDVTGFPFPRGRLG